MSLRTRFALVVAGAVAATVVAIAGVMLWAARDAATSQVDTTLVRRAEQLRARPLEEPTGSLPSRGRGERPFGRFVPDDVLIQIIDRRGRVVLGNVDPLPVSEGALAVAGGSEERYWQRLTVEGVNLRVLTVPIGRDAAVMVAQPVTELDASLRALQTVMIVVCLLGVAGAGAVGFLVAGRAIRPVRRLTEAAGDIAATQELDRHIEVERDDELGALATSFNQMLQALDESRRQQHRLVTDASHELRTPLTSVRTNIELLQRGAGADPEVSEQIMADVVAELDDLTSLVSELVALATSAHQTPDIEPFDLAAAVEAVVERQRRRTSVAINLEASPCTVMGVRALAERAVSNLVDNALKFGPADAPVDVTVRDGSVVVRDRGPGVPVDEREVVFERFYRSPRARGLPGSGLGLSIVQEVVHTMGGTVRLEEPSALGLQGDGLAVSIDLPIVDDGEP